MLGPPSGPGEEGLWSVQSVWGWEDLAGSKTLRELRAVRLLRTTQRVGGALSFGDKLRAQC